MAGNSHRGIANFIRGICNLLRGPCKRNEYRKVILLLTMLRRFDATLEPTKVAVFEAFDGLKGKSETTVEGGDRGAVLQPLPDDVQDAA